MCKGMLQDSLDNLVWVSIIQLALGSSEPAIYSSLSFCFHCHGQYYVALLGMVVISVLICVPLVTGTWTRLVQYIQLVVYGRIPYLNIDWNSWAIYCSFLSLLSRTCGAGAELLWSGRELTTKVGEQPWPQCQGRVEQEQSDLG